MTSDVAVVTGGGNGLGALLVRALARRGRHVLVADADADAGARLVREVIDAGGVASSVQVDLTTAAGVGEAVDRGATLGPLRLLVNCAGGWLPGPQYPDTDGWTRGLALNLVAPMLATQLALPHLVGGGAVVNVASSGGTDAGPYGSPEYGAAKAGIVRFTTSVGDFGERFGVRVSCVVPHWIGLPRAHVELAAMTPEQRLRSGGLVDPQVIVGVVLGLVDDPTSAGRVVVVRADRPPYVVPGAIDP